MEAWNFLKMVLFASLLPLQLYVSDLTGPRGSINMASWLPAATDAQLVATVVRDAFVDLFPEVFELFGYTNAPYDSEHTAPLSPLDHEANVGTAKDVDAAGLQRALKAHEYVMVYFYAPWCPHCDRFTPVLDSAVAILKDDSAMDLQVVRINGVNSMDLLDKYAVGSFPTVMLLSNQVPDSLDIYSGGASATELVTWTMSRAMPGGLGLPPSTLGRSGRPRLDRPEMLRFRVGDVVVHRYGLYSGVIVGWDAVATTPPGWTYDPIALDGVEGAIDTHSLLAEPHYLVLIHQADRAVEDAVYVPQALLHLSLERRIVKHDKLYEYVAYYDTTLGRYRPGPSLQVWYPKG